MRANAHRVRPVTIPLNMMTSPYAMRMIVRFLKMLRMISSTHIYNMCF